MTQSQNAFLFKIKNNFYIGYILLFVFLYFYLSLFEEAYIDDTFITLNYVRTLASSGTWGFFPDIINNTATSPLNVILLSVVSFFTNTEVDAVKWLSIFLFIFIYYGLSQISKQLYQHHFFTYLAYSALLFNPLLLSTLGLESVLFVSLFIFIILFFIKEKWFLSALLLGLLTMTRPEGGLVFILFLFFVPKIQNKVLFIGYYSMSVLPWFLFSWIYLGSVLPDTFFIKAMHKWGEFSYFNGLLLYLSKFPQEVVLTLLFSIFTFPLLLLNRQKNHKILYIILLIITLHFLAYSSMQVAPYHWYYTLQVLGFILITAFGFATLYQNAQQKHKLWIKMGLVGITLIPILGMLMIFSKEKKTSFSEVPIHTNWASHQKYKEIGLALKALKKKVNKDETIQTSAEIGTIAYYCECYLLNEFSDRRGLYNFAQVKKSESLFLSLNHLFLKKPFEFNPSTYQLTQYSEALKESILAWDTSSKWIAKSKTALMK